MNWNFQLQKTSRKTSIFRRPVEELPEAETPPQASPEPEELLAAEELPAAGVGSLGLGQKPGGI